MKISRSAGALASIALFAATLGTGSAMRAEEPSDTAARADCSFNVRDLRSPREMWHETSVRAELVAPSLRAQANAVAGGRRRPSNPPKGSTAPAPRNFIDSEIFGKMVRDGVQWTTRSGDAEFLRRVTLDLTGEVPDPDTVKAFLADPDSSKRDRAIDRLLASPAFVDRWTMWFGDHIQNVTTASNGAEGLPGRNVYYKYIKDSITADKAYDQMVRELIAGKGRSFTTGEVNFYVRQIQNNGPIQDTYDNLSAFTGQKFLALPLNCLSCHSGRGHLELVNSSLASRTRTEFWKNAAFFAQGNVRTEASDNGREYILSDVASQAYRLNTTSGNKTPRLPENGQSPTVDPAFFLSAETPRDGETRREAYGRILTAQPQFARATVNYLWKEIFGIGIVDPADSFDLLRQDPATLPPGATLQPTHPQLLNLLADSFRQNGYSLRAILKTIVQSNTYQLSSRYTPGNWNESWTPYYARHYPRRLMSEEVLDAIFRATNVDGAITINQLGTVRKAMQLPDPFEGGTFRNFLNAFGRGNRDDDERANDSSIVQALSLLNDRTVTDRIKTTAANSTASKLKATNDPEQIAVGLYLATLSRYPSDAEKAQAVAYLKSGDLTRKTEDLQFALVNRVEFLFN